MPKRRDLISVRKNFIWKIVKTYLKHYREELARWLELEKYNIKVWKIVELFRKSDTLINDQNFKNYRQVAHDFIEKVKDLEKVK